MIDRIHTVWHITTQSLLLLHESEFFIIILFLHYQGFVSQRLLDLSSFLYSAFGKLGQVFVSLA